MMLLLPQRSSYKPFSYPWAYEAYKAQQRMHWLPEEVSLREDIRDWNVNMSDQEKHLLTQIFRFFTQGDIDIAQGYLHKYIPMFGHVPELAMMLSSFVAMEAVHVDAYSLLLDTVGMPETEYAAFAKYKAMSAKHDYLTKVTIDDSLEEVARAMAVYSAFGEGLQLFSSFAILLNFPRFNKMKGMGQIVTWSIRDESLHVNSMIKLFETFIQAYPHIWTDDCRKEIYKACRKMVRLEEAFIDLAFEQGGIEGLTSNEVKQYVYYIADRRLLQLGLKPNYGVKDNPLPWIDTMVNAVEHTNFFENRATEYNKGSVVNWEKVWQTT